MDTLVQDLRYALRAVRKRPGFTAVAVLTLALGIGVNSAIFSIANVLLFNELPVADPDSAVLVWGTNARLAEDRALVTPAEFFAWRDQCRSFAGLSAMRQSAYVLSGWKEPIRVQAGQITDDGFGVWGIDVAPGRDFLPGEDEPGAAKVAILAHGFWQRRFGGDPEVIGRGFLLDGVEHTVVGVASPRIEFGDLTAIDLWVPLGMDAATAPREGRSMFVVGRLRDGATLAGAREEVALVSSRLADEHPETYRGWSGRAVAFADGMVNRNTWVILTLLGFMVGFVLLMACINVANMLLSRAAARRKEMAVRGALGAGRARLLVQLLTESFLIALAAAVLGLGLARGLLAAMASIASRDTFIGMIAMDGQVVLFTLAVALAAPLLFGLVPSLRASRPDLQQTLRDTAAATGGGRASRSRGLLVALQVALALMLMVSAGLVTRTVIYLQGIDLGFDPDGIITAVVRLPERGYEDDEAVRRFFDTLTERAAALPGSRGAGLVSHLPLARGTPAVGVQIDGRAPDPEGELPAALLYTADPSYFGALELPLERGRHLAPSDTAGAPPVAVISERGARQLWPGEDPLGRRVRLGAESEGPWTEIVGVVGDVGITSRQTLGLPQIYVPRAQRPAREMALAVRAAGDPLALAPELRRAVWSLDPEQPVDQVRTMSQVRYDLLASSYALVMLFLVFAGFALAIAAVGLYGVTSYTVSQRTQEIGIRMALGAGVGEVAAMVLRQSLTTVAAGTAAGLAGAFLLSRLMRGVIFGISALDPLTFIGVPLVLALVALAANLIPARRAMRIDPVTSLRSQ